MGEMSDYYNHDWLYSDARLKSTRKRREPTEEEKAWQTDPTYWVSRDGRVKRIKDMDDQHLNNSIAMVERGGAANMPPLLEAANAEDTMLALTQLKLMGIGPMLYQRYENLLKERARREENKRIEEAEADGADPEVG